ncbi:MAG: hypothetical protein KIS63_03020 [Caldilineales bacterium]|nr:hypothetical protein [Caldilineales bacterium]
MTNLQGWRRHSSRLAGAQPEMFEVVEDEQYLRAESGQGIFTGLHRATRHRAAAAWRRQTIFCHRPTSAIGKNWRAVASPSRMNGLPLRLAQSRSAPAPAHLIDTADLGG